MNATSMMIVSVVVVRQQTRGVVTVLRTFIGCGTMSDCPIPPHFQMKSLAKTKERIKLDTQLFKDNIQNI